MHVVKKYANRKLYHTNRKQYITLDGIAQLIRGGESVQVFDNETGADITATTLSQVILQLPERSGGLPVHVLTSLIQLGGDALAGLRRIIFTSLGGSAWIETDIQRRLDQLVAAGTLEADDARQLADLLLQRELAAPTDELVMSADAVPDRSDIVRLNAQVETLAATVETLLRQHTRHDAYVYADDRD